MAAQIHNTMAAQAVVQTTNGLRQLDNLLRQAGRVSDAGRVSRMAADLDQMRRELLAFGRVRSCS